MKNINIPIRIRVDINKALMAIFCVLKITRPVNNKGKILIRLIYRGSIPPKTWSITKAKVCAENEQAAILAIQKKNPIINAKKPPKPSLVKL